MQQQFNGWDRLVHGAQHTVFRLVSLIFSGASAWAIYWFFSALGDDVIQRYVTIGTSVGFVVLGYFVTRGLAYRMMHKRRVRSYVLIAVLYILVEVSCNFAHAAARYPGVAWIHHLHGWQFVVFSFLLPVVLSIIPLFNIALAAIDVDLMHEKGALGQMGMMQPKPGPAVFSMSGARGPQGPVPQVPYPAMPAPTVVQRQGPPNTLKAYWDQVRGLGPQVPPPTQVQGMGMNGSGVP
jgi:hypothetical protein